ncbi:MAG: YggU family protein [Candidatus Parabeggiatoa sp. nov. 2]|nr:MAG: YggU family protein [Beggiatoa sp. 4572_84]RKZ58177.1 MAG: YggU family protein [Gammaproteobacteria bacterium]
MDNYQLPITNYQLPITNYQLPITKNGEKVMTFYHWEGEDLVLFVHVQPRASRAGIVGVHGDKLKVKITSAPVDGQANADVCKLFSKVFGVAKSRIVLRSGHTSRDKCFCIKSPKNLPDLIASPMRISR